MLATQPKKQRDQITDVQKIEPNNNDMQQAPQVINNYNVYGTSQKDNSVIVKHDKNETKFTLFNSNNQILGSFTILQLFKFLNKKHDFYLVEIKL